jgi:type IV secretion system protein VirB1
MVMSLIAVTALAAQCAPSVAPQTLLAVVRVESGFDPLAIGVNGPQRTQLHPATAAEARATAERLISQGLSVDLGLGQINSKNLSALGLSVSGAFDACSNLEASGRVLQAAYASTSGGAQGQNLAVLKALSIYNTGRTDRGFRNGYVAKVTAAAASISAVPVLPPSPKPAPAAWDVFAQAEGRTSFVLTPAGTGEVQ